MVLLYRFPDLHFELFPLLSRWEGEPQPGIPKAPLSLGLFQDNLGRNNLQLVWPIRSEAVITQRGQSFEVLCVRQGDVC